MDEKTDGIIRAILKRGNDVQIQRKGNGYVILEVRRIIRAANPEVLKDEKLVAKVNEL